MQTSRFQLGLVATLALGLGVSVASSDAVGYPAGPAGSMGQNPIVTSGGTVNAGGSATLFSAPADQDLIITDIVLTSGSTITCKREHRTELSHSGGGTLGHFVTSSASGRQYNQYDSSSATAIQHAFGSGLRVPAGSSVTLTVQQTAAQGPSCGVDTDYGVSFAVAGYLAQM